MGDTQKIPQHTVTLRRDGGWSLSTKIVGYHDNGDTITFDLESGDSFKMYADHEKTKAVMTALRGN